MVETPACELLAGISKVERGASVSWDHLDNCSVFSCLAGDVYFSQGWQRAQKDDGMKSNHHHTQATATKQYKSISIAILFIPCKPHEKESMSHPNSSCLVRIIVCRTRPAGDFPRLEWNRKIFTQPTIPRAGTGIHVAAMEWDLLPFYHPTSYKGNTPSKQGGGGEPFVYPMCTHFCSHTPPIIVMIRQLIDRMAFPVISGICPNNVVWVPQVNDIIAS